MTTAGIEMTATETIGACTGGTPGVGADAVNDTSQQEHARSIEVHPSPELGAQQHDDDTVPLIEQAY